MKIAIDCADLDHSRIDGTRVYIKNLLNWFGRLDPDNQFWLYHQTDFNRQLAPAMFLNYSDRKIPYRFWWTQTRLAFELIHERPDVCWMPIQQLPTLAKGKVKFVATIHDLAFKLFPSNFTALDRFKLNLFTDQAVRYAAALIAVSESTKNDIIRLYPKTDPNKIHVIHHGFDADTFSKKASESELTAAKDRWKIGRKPYILYVGAIQPRKDLVTLIKAFEKIKSEDKSGLKLVLVGEPAWKAEETLSAIEKSPRKEDIIQTGKVTFHDLPLIYQGAEIFAMPSRYEGFGLPLLEAFASGTPVIAADNSSLAEIGADAALKFETGNDEALAAALRKLLENATLKEELRKKGIERARQFSWQRCASQTLEILVRTAAKR